MYYQVDAGSTAMDATKFSRVSAASQPLLPHNAEMLTHIRQENLNITRVRKGGRRPRRHIWRSPVRPERQSIFSRRYNNGIKPWAPSTAPANSDIYLSSVLFLLDNIIYNINQHKQNADFNYNFDDSYGIGSSHRGNKTQRRSKSRRTTNLCDT